jgi:hypothetical protein
MPTGWNFVAIDLGQARDFTAIAAVEWAELQGEWDAATFAHRKYAMLRLRYLKRLPLGMSYVDVVEKAAQVVQSETVAGRCHLIVDATGVGRPVVDMLQKQGLGCRLMPVTITGGETEGHTDGFYRIPKRNLVAGVQVLLQCGGLKAAEGLPYGEELKKELEAMEVKVTASGNTQYGAWREGAHDDLALAVMLACWGAKKMYPNALYGEEAYWRRKDQREWGDRLKKQTAPASPIRA